jgi:hypothetical protein
MILIVKRVLPAFSYPVEQTTAFHRLDNSLAFREEIAQVAGYGEMLPSLTHQLPDGMRLRPPLIPKDGVRLSSTKPLQIDLQPLSATVEAHALATP